MNRSIRRLIICYIVIIGAIYLSEWVSFWFYPLAIIVLGNQYYSLSLLGHDGVHGLLHKNIFLNQFIARYFCHFPVFISFSHYSVNHLRHHRNLGTADDPDIKIYENAYPTFSKWLSESVQNTITLKSLLYFINYFNGSLDYIQGRYPFKIKTDMPQFLVFWGIVLFIVFSAGVHVQFFLYFILPVAVLLPWFFIGNLYQHYTDENQPKNVTNTIVFKNIWLQELLFPLNLNYHEVHHKHPDIPYYLLPNYSESIERSFTFADFSKTLFNSQKNKSS